MISKNIKKVRLLGDGPDFKALVWYKLIGSDTEERVAVITFKINRGESEWMNKNITDAMFDIQMILGIAPNKGTIDFHMFKDIPDGAEAGLPANPIARFAAVSEFPGESYWEAENLR